MDVITTHLNADFDGLASMVAGRKLYPGALLVLPGGTQEAVRHFLAVHDLGITRLKDIDQSEITRLILVDTQEPDRLGLLKAVCVNPTVTIHVYDHHVASDPDDESRSPLHPEQRIIESVGATTTLLVERLMAQHLAVTPFEATVLALGLYEETGLFAFSSTTPRDLEAAAFALRAGADLTLVTDTLQRRLDLELIELLSDLLHSSQSFYLEGRKVLLAASGYDRYRGELAEAVHKLAEMEGYDAVVAVIAMGDKVEIIARSRRTEIDVGRLLREFGGGGHTGAAAASVKGRTLIEIKEQLAELLTQRFRPTLLARDVMTSPVKVIGETATVEEAETALTKYGVNALPVVTAKQRYRGVLTRETVQKGLFHRLGQSSVVEFMQPDAYTADPETPFRDIEAQMVERNQRVVPIVMDGKPVGVITRTDLLRTLHDDVLAAARARVRGETPLPVSRHRNVANLIATRLPIAVGNLLKQAGTLAERTTVSVFVVGGFVRDLLLGGRNLDVDLVVEGDGIAYARALAKEWHATVTIHDRFGTGVLVLPDGFKVDVATARTEYYEYPTALPTVERSSIKKDLFRRDFTINTLAVRLDARRFGELLDFYGGQRDLNEKTIRILHSLSFVEDPTRVFRALRFERRFGFRLAKETLALIKGAVKMDLFYRVSGARILEELVLLFSEDKPRDAILRLRELDLLRFIHSDLKRPPKLDAFLKSVEEALAWYRLLYLNRSMEEWIVYVQALMDPLPVPAVKETLTRLAVPERVADKIRIARFRSTDLLRRLGRRPGQRPSDIYRILTGLPDEVLLFLMAKTQSEAVRRQLSAYVTTYQHVRPQLTGKDLQRLGVRPGPIYRRILDRLLEARLNGEITTEAEERAMAESLANS